MIRFPAMVVVIAVVTGAVVLGCSGEDEERGAPTRTTAETTTTTTTRQAKPSTTTVRTASTVGGPLEFVIGRSRAATALRGLAECSAVEPGVALASLRWRPARDRGTEQRIAITILPNGFETGEFRLSEPLGRNAATLEWRAIEGQAIHYWRVLTRQPDGWVASGRASFTGPICVSDEGTS